MTKILAFTPDGVCFNCLNGGHHICQYEYCKCASREHKQWWFRDDGITTEAAALQHDAHQDRLERDRGICTNIVESAAENIARIRFILSAYESFLPLQRASRTADDWEPVHDLPSNFDSYRYRLAR